MGTNTKVRLSIGKFNGINAVADETGLIAAAAMDQRGSLKKAIAKARGGDASSKDLSEFKIQVTEVLTRYASAILLDPEYGLEALKHRAPNAGVFLAYEKTGYDTNVGGRLPDLLDEWSVRRLVAAGADVIKVLMYYMLDHVHGGFHLDMRRFTWCFPSAGRLPNTSTFGLCVYCQAIRPWLIIAIISGTVVTLTRGRPCL